MSNIKNINLVPKAKPVDPIVTGKGTSTSDSIPAKYSKGEAVLSADVVKFLGKPLVRKLVNLVPKAKGAKTEVKDGVLHAAGGVDADALNRINKITGVSTRWQGAIPMPADQANAQMQAKQSAQNANAANSGAFNQAKMDADARVSAARSAVNSATPTQPIVNDTTIPKAGVKGFLGRLGENMAGAGAMSTQIASDVLSNPMVAKGRDEAIAQYKANPQLARGALMESKALAPVQDYVSRNIIEPIMNSESKPPSIQGAAKMATTANPAAAFDKTADGAIADRLLSQPGMMKQAPLLREMANKQAGIVPVAETTQVTTPAAGVSVEQAPYMAKGKPSAGGVTPISNIGNRAQTTFTDGQGGSASVQFADGRTLNETQQSDLSRTIARNADPAVQAKFAEQAAISQGRYDRAKEFGARIAQENQQKMQANQIQQAYNTLMAPVVQGDLLGGLAQKKQKAAAAQFLNLANDQRSEQDRLKAQQGQFNANLGVDRDKLSYQKANDTAANKIASEKNAIEEQKLQEAADFKRLELMKPQVISKNTYENGIINGQEQSAIQFDPETKSYSLAPLKGNDTPDSLFAEALKAANAEKDPKKRQFRIDWATKAYQEQQSQKAK